MRKKNQDLVAAILDYYNTYYEEHLCSPACSEVARKLNVSKSTIIKYVKYMKEEGMLEQVPGKRGYLPADMVDVVPNSVPKVGYVSCGQPVLAEENIEEYLSIPNWMLKTNGKYFCLRASGDSMIGAGISSGDMLIIRQQEEAQEGDIVVALTESGENTLKRLKYDPYTGKIILHPENPNYEDIYCDYIQVQGVVEKIIKDAE